MTSLQIHISVWFNTINTIAGVGGGGGGGGGGEGVLKKCLPFTIYTIFLKKGTPFLHFLLTNGTPFTYLV